jgi:response regulator RpfG family c-di-GMP phosphodiesterase
MCSIQQNIDDPQNKLFSLIITDYCVPSASGIEILRKAKLLTKMANKLMPKVIMLSALEDPLLQSALKKEKLVDMFFFKPVQNDILEEAVKKLL